MCDPWEGLEHKIFRARDPLISSHCYCQPIKDQMGLLFINYARCREYNNIMKDRPSSCKPLTSSSSWGENVRLSFSMKC